jgi:putative DNA methylase
MTFPKKLIEVALPLEAINEASAREKGVRGHPNTLHQWWARRPLAACRSVIFASLVDDPGEYLPEQAAAPERERLFRLMARLADWSGATDEHVLREALLEIARSTARSTGLLAPQTDADVQRLLTEVAPPVYDPFSGSGSIPIEAQRLGLRTFASDLNPVAVVMTRAMIDLPVRYGNRPPANPGDRAGRLAVTNWRGTAGLRADIRYYADWIRTEAERRLGGLYPRGRGVRTSSPGSGVERFGVPIQRAEPGCR